MKRIILSIVVLLLMCSCQKNFSQDEWLNEPDNRKDIVYDLVKKHQLKEMSESEIIQLLGEPEQRIDGSNIQYVYFLGRASLGVDDSLFRIHFNHNGKLETYKITSD